MQKIVIVGATQGVGLALAYACAREGNNVILSGRDSVRAELVADAIAEAIPPGRGNVAGIGLDLSQPHTIGAALETIGQVDHVVIAGMVRDSNTLANYSIDRAIMLATTKIAGYTAVVHHLRDRLEGGGSVLLFGGRAKDTPYPGSTTVTAVNSAVVGLVKTLAVEIAPVRVNAIHPGLVADSPFWIEKSDVLQDEQEKTLSGRLPLMRDIVDGCFFLMRNPAANGVNLGLDGGLR